MSILDRILRAGEGRTLRRLQATAAQVDALEGTYSDYSDAEIKEETDRFKARLADGETLDDLLPEAFSLVREASVRTLGQRHYTVQVVGGVALHEGNIAEMKTGEGKTLVATLPSYLNALTGKGVHVVTVNDYLASYQSELMGRVYRALGLSTGCIITGQKPPERRKQYAADITYGTNNEFGFDYLRDNMAWQVADLVQREHNYVIVDEVDSILIDEARTPLIISGPASGDANKWYVEFSKLARMMIRDRDYEVDEKKRTVGILEPGIDRVEDHLGIINLYDAANTPLIGFLNNSIKAKELFHRDKDYIVHNGEVLIVDEHTGRVLPGRRYNEGMHQAIEAKEGVVIKAENQTLATITLQNYFRLYDKLAGMTGTAETEAEEFASTYKIGVVPIPTNMPMIRDDRTDLVYGTAQAKYNAIVNDISERHRTGQPVLVGTASVEKSEILSDLLKKARIPHEVLNAKQHEREASVVAMAGRKGAVTVATNMAGRGTDIMLGGNAEHLAVTALKDQGLDPTETPEEYEAAWPAALERAKEAVAAEHDEVVELGGLYVLGSERHESRRIDNQLRGRSGRQGDPGESRFYLSLEDDLLRLFNAGLAARFMNSDTYPEDEPIENKFVSKGIERAQTSIESRNFEIRKNVLKYDDVMNDQRSAVYSERRRILEGENLADQIQRILDQVVTTVVDAATANLMSSEWDLDALIQELKSFYPVSITADDLREEFGEGISREDLLREILSDVHVAYDSHEERLGEETMRELERLVLLRVMDTKWREHLYEMDYLKEGIGLRAMAQRDPLVEYKREGYDMFQVMNENIKEDTVKYLFAYQPAEPEEAEEETPEPALAAAPAHRSGARKVAIPPTAAAKGAPGRRVASPLRAAATGAAVGGVRIDPFSQQPQQENLTMSGPADDASGETQVRRAAAPGAGAGNKSQRAASAKNAAANRQQRRAAAKKKRKRR